MQDSKFKAERTASDPRWQQVLARDAAADGLFFYSVKTTGVYCRPSCGARQARPEHVDFHSTREAAEAAGFRPCKRCKPDQPGLVERKAALVEQACRFIESAETVPTLEQLAARTGLSAHHFHRTFKALTGLTPKAYVAAHRQRLVKENLDMDKTVTEAIYAAGYSSNSRFYAASGKMLGMKPLNYKKGGKDTHIHFAVAECSLGSLLVASSNIGVCAILLDDDPEVLVRDLQDRFPHSNLIGGDAGYEQLVAKVVGFIEAPQLGLDLPLDIRGTAFQQRVWQALREIPCGVTVSYSDIAGKIGKPKAVRAVARACGANALAVAIPCHRVVRTDGALSGYRWGIARKYNLLRREADLIGPKKRAG